MASSKGMQHFVPKNKAQARAMNRISKEIDRKARAKFKAMGLKRPRRSRK